MAPALCGGRDVIRKVHLYAADTALAPLWTMRRRRRTDSGRDVLRDRGARTPMERADRVLMVQSPNGIARIPLTMRGTIHGGIDDEGIVQAAAVQTILLPMRVTARGINDVLITMTVRA